MYIFLPPYLVHGVLDGGLSYKNCLLDYVMRAKDRELLQKSAGIRKLENRKNYVYDT